MNFQSACALGLEAVGYISEHTEILARFLGTSGLSPEDLSERLEDPVMLQAIMAFLMTDDDMLTDFCESQNCDYREVHTAVYLLENAGI